MKTARAMRALAALAVLLGMSGALAPGPAAATGPPAWPLAGTSAGTGPVVLVGIGGLRWSDVTASATPTLWARLPGAAAANLSVRTAGERTCPADGWLTIGAGRRAQAAGAPGPACRGMPAIEPLIEPTVAPTATGGTPGPAQVGDWAGIVTHNRSLRFGAAPGLLGSALASGTGGVAAGAGVATLAVGPGAALALADESGRVPDYLPSAAALTPARFARLTAVDLGTITATSAGDRQRQVRDADARFADVLAAAPSGATLMLLAPTDAGPPDHLTVALVRAGGAAAGPAGTRALTSDSTRRVGITQLTDVLPTVTTALGLPTPPAAIGSPMTATGAPGGATGRVAALRDLDLRTRVEQDVVLAFFVGLGVLQLLAYVATYLLLVRPRRGAAPARVLGLAFAAVPVSTFVANLLPWWRLGTPDDPWREGAPLAAVSGLTGVLALAVAGLASLAGRHGRTERSLLVVVAVTVLVLAGDLLTGGHLQVSSLMGYPPTVGGRFYGVGNVAFGVLAAGGLLTAALLAGEVVGRGRVVATAVAGVTGLAVLAVDGAPGLGSDLGGALSLAVGLGVLLLLVAGARVSLPRLSGVLAGALAVVAALTLADYARGPARRTHLGRFADAVLHGGAGDVLTRKLDANLAMLGAPFGWLAPVAVLVAAAVVLAPARFGAPSLAAAFARWPRLRAGLVAVLVTGVLAALVNDSGVVIPIASLAVAGPLGLVAALAAGPRAEASPPDQA